MTSATSTLAIGVDSRRGTTQVRAFNSELDKLTRNGQKADSQMLLLNRAIVGVGSAVGGIATIGGITTLVRDLAELQGINSRLSSLTGDLAGQQSFLRETAEELSTEYTVLASGYSRLLPLYKAGLLSLEQTRDITRGLANAQAAAGASSADLGRSIFGLSQGLSAGVLRSEELNQVTESLPGLLQELDKASGLASGGFRKLVNEGKVTSDFFRDTLQVALRAYEGAAASSGDNITQTFNRTRNEYALLVEALNDPISIGVGAGAESLEASLRFIRENLDGISDAATVAGVSVGAVLTSRAIGSGGASLKAVIEEQSQAFKTYMERQRDASIASQVYADVQAATSAKVIASREAEALAEATLQREAAKADLDRNRRIVSDRTSRLSESAKRVAALKSEAEAQAAAVQENAKKELIARAQSISSKEAESLAEATLTREKARSNLASKARIVADKEAALSSAQNIASKKSEVAAETQATLAVIQGTKAKSASVQITARQALASAKNNAERTRTAKLLAEAIESESKADDLLIVTSKQAVLAKTESVKASSVAEIQSRRLAEAKVVEGRASTNLSSATRAESAAFLSSNKAKIDAARVNANLSKTASSVTLTTAQSTIAQEAAAKSSAAINAANLRSASLSRQLSNAKINETKASNAFAATVSKEAAAINSNNAAKIALVGTSSRLTASINAATIATGKLTLAQRAGASASLAFGLAQKGAATGLALLGGPSGIILTAAAGLAYLYVQESEAEKITRELTEAVGELGQAYSTSTNAGNRLAGQTRSTALTQLNQARAELQDLQQRAAEARDAETLAGARQFIRLSKQASDQKEVVDSLADSLDNLNNEVTRYQLEAGKVEFFSFADNARNQLAEEAERTRKEIAELRAETDKFDDQNIKLQNLELLQERLEAVRNTMDPAEFQRRSQLVQNQINDLNKVDTSAAQQALRELNDLVDSVLPDQARIRENEKNLDLLFQAFERTGDVTFQNAFEALSEQIRGDTLRRAAEQVKDVNDALSARVQTPFSDYADEIELLNRAFFELPDEAGNLAQNIQTAFSNLDFEIQTRFTVVSGGTREELERSFNEQTAALEQFHAAREISEDQANQNRLALQRSYGDQVASIQRQIQDQLLSFGEISVGVQFEIDTSREIQELETLLRDGQITRSQFETAAEQQAIAHQERLAEIVRSGQATQAQAQTAGFQDRFIGFRNQYDAEIQVVENSLNAIFNSRVADAQRQAEVSNLAFQADEQALDDARQAYEQNASEENRIALQAAQNRLAISQQAAEQQFQQQKKEQIRAAKIQAGIAVLNALATPPWYLGLANAAIAAKIGRDKISDIRAERFSGVTASAATSAPTTPAANQTQQAETQPQQTLVIVSGSFTSEEDALRQTGSHIAQLTQQGTIFVDNGQPGGLNVENAQVQRVDLNG